MGEEPNAWLAHSEAQEAAIAQADRLIALTQSELELLQLYYPQSAGKTRIAGNGIDDSSFARAASLRCDDSNRLTLLYSGRLVERKGIRD